MSGDLIGIDASDINYENLIKEHFPKLSLPNYQRSYVWKKEKVTKLLDDMIHNREAPNIPNMFTGSILILRPSHETLDYELNTPARLKRLKLNTLNDLLKKLSLPSKSDKIRAIKAIEKNRPPSKIIDGQQRITTSMILAIILKSKTQEHNLKSLTSRLKNIIQTESDKLRLTLMGHDNTDLTMIFKKHRFNKPLPYNKKDKVWTNRGTGNSSNPICSAYAAINQWVEENISKYSTKAKQKKWLKDYTTYFLEKFGFILIRVKHAGQGHLVFKSLNSTGEKLTSGELIKSMLFYKGLRNPTLNLESHWDDLSTNLKSVMFGDEDVISNFWDTYAKSKGWKPTSGKGVTNSNLATVIEHHFDQLNFSGLQKEVSNMVDESKNYSHLLIPPASPKWAGVSRKNDLVDLRLLGFKQVRPLLLCARRKCNDSDFDQVIKIIMTLIGRVFLCTDTNPNILSTKWKEWPEKLEKNGPSYVATIKDETQKWLLTTYGVSSQADMNKKFKKHLVDLTVNKNDTAKHYLRVVGTLQGNPYPDYNRALIQAEHIFPKSAKSKFKKTGKVGKWWAGNRWKNPQKSKLMFGNFVLLEAEINNKIKTKTWKEGSGTKVSQPKNEADYGKYHGMRYLEFKVGATKFVGTQFKSTQEFLKEYAKKTKWTEKLIHERTKALADEISRHSHWIL